MSKFISTISSNNYLIAHRTLLRKLGTIEGLLLNELISEYDYWKKENKLLNGKWFFSTIENIEYNTGIMRNKQYTYLNRLIERGYIEKKNIGMPAKRYFSINTANIEALFEENTDCFNEAPCLLQRSKQDDLNEATNNNNTILQKNTTNEYLFSPDFSTKNPDTFLNTFVDKYKSSINELMKLHSNSSFIKKHFNGSTMKEPSIEQQSKLLAILDKYKVNQLTKLLQCNLTAFLQQDIVNGNFINKKDGSTIYINFATVYNNKFGIDRQLSFNNETQLMNDEERIEDLFNLKNDFRSMEDDTDYYNDDECISSTD